MNAERTETTIAEEAAEWAVLMDSGDPGREARRAFAIWLKASPEHVREYLLAEAMFAAAGRTSVDRTAAPTAAPVLRRPQIRRTGGLVGLAAAACLIVVLGAALVHLTPDEGEIAHRPAFAAFTAPGEQSEYTLADGTRVALASDTRLGARSATTGRAYALIAGEAFFDVAPDPERPFTVEAGLAMVTVLGTEFSVRRHDNQLDVAVAEGRVRIEREDATLELTAGHAVAWTATGPGPIRKVRPADVAAWRRGRLVFEDAPLADVLAEFNRWGQVQLVLESGALDGVRLTGAFEADNPEALLVFLERRHGARTVREAGEIRIGAS